MKRLDLRTAIVVLTAVVLGYAICLVVPVAKADLDRLEVSEIVADKIIARQSLQSEGTIGFVDGPQIYGSGGSLLIMSKVEASGDIVSAGDLTGDTGLIVHGTKVIDSSRKLNYVIIDRSVKGGNGLDVGKLSGHPVEDFVLKSEIDDNFCRIFYPLALKSE